MGSPSRNQPSQLNPWAVTPKAGAEINPEGILLLTFPPPFKVQRLEMTGK